MAAANSKFLCKLGVGKSCSTQEFRLGAVPFLAKAVCWFIKMNVEQVCISGKRACASIRCPDYWGKARTWER